MAKKGYLDSSDKVKLRYEIFGEGKPLLMLAGGPGYSHEQLLGLKFLSKYAELVYFDPRGTGKSSKTDPKNYTLHSAIEDVESVRKELGFSEVSLLGFGWGASVAMAYSLEYLANVDKLILVSPFASADDLNEVFRNLKSKVSREQQEFFEKCEKEGLYVNGKYREDYIEALQPIYDPFTVSVPFSKQLARTFAEIDYDVYRVMWGEESEFQITGTMKELDLRHQLRDIKVPSLIIIGESDLVPIELAKRDAETMHNSKLVILENARHFSFIDQPKKFEQAVKEFLASTE